MKAKGSRANLTKRLPLIVAVIQFWLSLSDALASGGLGPEGSPIQTSEYSIDLFAGPVLSSSRVTGLAGAYAGMAEGIEGNTVNAAAPAFRVPWSYDWLDYDISLGITLPGMLGKTDFDNNGAKGFAYNDFVFLNGGLNLQAGKTGIGLSADSRIYRLGAIKGQETSMTTQYAQISLTSIHMLLARAFARGQLCVGAGLRAVMFEINAEDREDGMGNSKTLASMAGYAAEIGGLWAPHELPIRVGLSWRQQVVGKVPDDQTDTQNEGEERFWGELPRSVELPWELEAGVAWELGSRPLNPEWIDPAEFSRPLLREVRSSRAKMLSGKNGSATQLRPEDLRALRAEEEEKVAEQLQDLRARRELEYRHMSRERFLLSASLLVTGATKDGVGTESFFRKIVERSGRRISWTPRIGVEAEPFSNRLQVRTGCYLEPTRYDYWHSRLHFTAGFDLRVLTWSALGLAGENTSWAIGAVLDTAQGYTSASFRVGTWR